MTLEKLFYLVGSQERTQCSALVITEYIKKILQEMDTNHNYSLEQGDLSLGRNGLARSKLYSKYFGPPQRESVQCKGNILSRSKSVDSPYYKFGDH